MEKRMLTLADVEAQSALELPSREMMALLVVIVKGIDVDVELFENAEIANNWCTNVGGVFSLAAQKCTIGGGRH